MSNLRENSLVRPSSQPVIMGVVNVTPDSFSDGGTFHREVAIDHAAAVTEACHMAEAGAAIIDVGGEASSFHRPGIVPIAAEEQLRRVEPVVRALAARRQAGETALRGLRISVDTRSSAVARVALEAGADIINDISAATDDPDMLALAAATKSVIILMHRHEEKPGQPPPVYQHVCREVFDYLQRRSEAALAAGVEHTRIWLDPGLGFGKSAQDNWQLLAGIGELVQLGFVVVLGASRKRFLADLLPVTQRSSHPECWPARDIITSQVVALAAARGVAVHRVHNVELARQALEVAEHMAPGGTCACSN